MMSEFKGRSLLGQYLIWVILLVVQLHGCKCCIEIERKALLELKKYWVITNPESDFYLLSTWNNDTKSDCCQWQGIMCNHTSGRIIKLSFPSTIFKENSLVNLSLLHPFEEIRSLDLSSGKFNGFVDNVEGYKSLRKLRKLEILDLSFNEFNKSIFPFLSAATSLTSLSLQSNSMDGPFPFEVCEMKNLQELDLERNHFVGQLPLCLGRLKKLRVLDFSSNQLSGNLPYSFNSLESLEYLSLLDNNFTSLFSLHPLANLTKLQVFKLSSTSGMVQVDTESTWEPQFQLSVVVLRFCSLDKIPSFLENQKSLRLVDLSSNKLSGNIPTWLLANNPQLGVLQLQNNAFTIFQMPSTIVHNLRFLDFSANGISGLFPDNIGHALPNIERMNGSHNGFQGHFPSSMGEMVNITFLDLSYNNFSGKIPRSFVTGCISLEQLKLSHNKFNGPFLPSETSLSSLKELRMDSNSFTGQIGVGLLSSNTTLSVLDMSNNFLVGAIPSWISNLSSLNIFLISNNFLEGKPPPSLMAMSSLSFLDLSRNLFSGALPSHIGGDFWMQVFLHDNNFTGPIPKTLESVQILDLRNNKLSGSIPQFVNADSLKILLLKGNNLTGSIPRQLCDLSNMKLLDLSENKLNGFIPSCLYNLSFGPEGDKNDVVDVAASASVELRFYKSEFVVERFVVESLHFQEVEIKFATKQRYDSYFGAAEFTNSILDYMYGMDLSSNELHGVIPQELGNLLALRVMNLSHNFLSSSIPSSFSNLTDIESLDLSYNKLQGSIPQQLTSLNSLAVFDVSYNNLSGMIPQGKQFNTFDENSYLGNPLLCGPPTNRSCEAKKRSEEADNRGEEKEEDEAAIDMVVFYFSSASTYVTALIGILILMCVDCPWRRAWLRIVDAFIASSKVCCLKVIT